MLDALGYAASFAVLCTFLTRTMGPLRLIAILSNVLFVLYGYFDRIAPVMVLHLTLLPINVWRLVVMQSELNLSPRALRRAYVLVRSTRPYAFWFAVGLLTGLMGPLAVLIVARTPHA